MLKDLFNDGPFEGAEKSAKAEVGDFDNVIHNSIIFNVLDEPHKVLVTPPTNEVEAISDKNYYTEVGNVEYYKELFEEGK